MSPSPAATSNQADIDRYGASWSAIMQLVREGNSWSGGERNCAYLNEGTGRFSDISYLSGLDTPDDGRALAVVDWDQDGDLDLWFRNRTAPRLRLMRNLHTTGEDDGVRARVHGFVALRTEGTSSNRDGIGAIVEVVAKSNSRGPAPKLVKSVRAGDLFLSQSSKWLHFGLGDLEQIQEVRVLWPGGTRETFRGVRPNGRYVLRQGSGVATEWKPRTERLPVALSAEAAPVAVPVDEASADEATVRILLPRRIPFPRLSYRDAAGPKKANPEATARVLLIWASTCPHCRRELRQLALAAPALRAAGLDVLALCVDALDPALDPTEAAPTAPGYRAIEEAGFPFPWGFLDAASADRIREFQRALFDRTVATTVPLTFLVDQDSNALAIYRGPIAPSALIEDARRATGATNEELHHLAPPLAGSWFTNAVDDASMAEFMARQFQERLPEDSLPYLELAVARSEPQRKLRLERELVGKQLVLARQYKSRNQPKKAMFYFESALQHAPGTAEIHYDYGILLAQNGKLDEAEHHLLRALEIQPDLQPAADGLRLVRELLSVDKEPDE